MRRSVSVLGNQHYRDAIHRTGYFAPSRIQQFSLDDDSHGAEIAGINVTLGRMREAKSYDELKASLAAVVQEMDLDKFIELMRGAGISVHVGESEH
ncbi:MAG: hypothetical protein ACLQDV_02795 [Candidatus Binataceae bacterium]